MPRQALVVEFPFDTDTPKPYTPPRKRLFYLGSHTYGGAPGMSWRSEFWVKRVKRGTRWELYGTDEETGKARSWMGEYSPEGIRQYFDSVEFHISDEEWEEMGWRGSIAEVVQLQEPTAAAGGSNG